MAFCSNCGNQLEANERFCVKCGSDTTVKAGGAAAPGVAAVAPTVATVAPGMGASGPRPVPSMPMPPVQPVQPYQPMAPMPGAYVAPGPIPVGVAIPQQAQQKKGLTMGTVVVLIALAVGGYYYYTHYYERDHPAASQTPGQTPPAGPAQPPGPAQPNGPQSGGAAALGKQQAFDAHWQAVNGFIQLSNGKWTNNASVAVQSATLVCQQLDAAGNDLDEMRTTLNGPVQPGGTDTFDPFNVGAVASNLSRVSCTIQYAKAVGQ